MIAVLPGDRSGLKPFDPVPREKAVAWTAFATQFSERRYQRLL